MFTLTGWRRKRALFLRFGYGNFQRSIYHIGVFIFDDAAATRLHRRRLKRLQTVFVCAMRQRQRRRCLIVDARRRRRRQ